MVKNRDHDVIQKCREWPIPLPSCLKQFANLVGDRRKWDFKVTQNFRQPPCPSAKCEFTVTLCGHCVFYDVPGNLHYGWVGRAANIPRWLLTTAAHLVSKGFIDDKRDQEAIRIEMEVWDAPPKRAQKQMFDEVNKRIKKLNRDRTKNCNVCNIKFFG